MPSAHLFIFTQHHYFLLFFPFALKRQLSLKQELGDETRAQLTLTSLLLGVKRGEVLFEHFKGHALC